ncbi:MAG: MBL fold metallo-hydrolase [Bacteroidales bacterium]|nr:MBL fold metallo-hydrolase [Bacteroidales bacterium]
MKQSVPVFFILILLSIQPAAAQRDFSDSEITKLVLLGTGNPNPSPDRSGCSLALVVNQSPYVIDFGPGLVRRSASLSPSYGGNIAALETRKLKTAFLTHLHSDHTAGYADLILTPWVMGREEPMEVYGPVGIGAMTEHILLAYQEDISYRVYGDEPANDQGWRVNWHEFKAEGEIYRDSNIVVEAFPVTHGSWPNSWGFRFTTPDKVIVISGDCKPSPKVLEYGKGADILVHEVYSQAGYETRSADWKAYHAVHHSSTLELAEIARETRPAKVVLYHILFWGSSEAGLLNEIASQYKGEVYVGQDLDIF